MEPIYGVSALIRRVDGFVLAVARRDDPNDLGLPGGRVEPGETPVDAAVRELGEETWLRARALAPVFDAMCGRHRAMTFQVLEWTGTPRSTPSGLVYWAPTAWLIDEMSPTFRDYNLQLFKKMNMRIRGAPRAGRDHSRMALPGRDT